MRIDETSLLVTTQTEIPLQRLESFLSRRGYTLGYRPAKGNGLTLRQCLDRRVQNLGATRYGEIDEICLAIQVTDRKGHRWETKKVPRAATGLDLKKIAIGSGGAYGTITQAVLRIVRRPAAGRTFPVAFPTAGALRRFARALQGSGLRPVMTFGARGKRSLTMILRLEGEKEIVDAEEATLMRLVRAARGKVGTQR